MDYDLTASLLQLLPLGPTAGGPLQAPLLTLDAQREPPNAASTVLAPHGVRQEEEPPWSPGGGGFDAGQSSSSIPSTRADPSEPESSPSSGPSSGEEWERSEGGDSSEEEGGGASSEGESGGGRAAPPAGPRKRPASEALDGGGAAPRAPARAGGGWSRHAARWIQQGGEEALVKATTPALLGGSLKFSLAHYQRLTGHEAPREVLFVSGAASWRKVLYDQKGWNGQSSSLAVGAKAIFDALGLRSGDELVFKRGAPQGGTPVILVEVRRQGATGGGAHGRLQSQQPEATDGQQIAAVPAAAAHVRATAPAPPALPWSAPPAPRRPARLPAAAAPPEADTFSMLDEVESCLEAAGVGEAAHTAFCAAFLGIPPHRARRALRAVRGAWARGDAALVAGLVGGYVRAHEQERGQQ